MPTNYRRNQNRLVVIAIISLFSLSVLNLIPSTLNAHALSPSTVVQEKNVGCSPCSPSSISVTFPSSLTLGDVIVVGVSSVLGSLSSISDSLSSSFTQAVSATEAGSLQYTYIYYSQVFTSASDTVTVAFSGSGVDADVYVFELSGVTTTGLGTANGVDSFGSSSVSTSSSLSFQPGAFLLAVINPEGATITPGSGFTLMNGYITPGYVAPNSAVEYATSGVTSPTNFPATLSGGFTWSESAIVLEPLAITTVTDTVTTTATTTLTTTTTSTITATSDLTTTSTSTTTLTSTSTSTKTVTNTTTSTQLLTSTSTETSTSTVTYVRPPVTVTDTSTQTMISNTTATSTVTVTEPPITSVITSNVTQPAITLTTTRTISEVPNIGSIIVFVYTSGESPLNNNLVTLSNGTFTKTISTNSSGETVFNGLSIGSTYHISATVDGAKLSAPASIGAGNSVTTVVLEPTPAHRSTMIFYGIGGSIIMAIVAAFAIFYFRSRH